LGGSCISFAVALGKCPKSGDYISYHLNWELLRGKGNFVSNCVGTTGLTHANWSQGFLSLKLWVKTVDMGSR
jgi:hypothetical protein